VTWKIRESTPEDETTLEEIERASFTSGHWLASDFQDHDCIVLEYQERVVGFVVTQQIYGGANASLPEFEVLNIAVLPEYRRLGFACALLKEALSRPGVFFLEVRESNDSAQSLYRKLGFREVARRQNYYQDPNESAIVMRAEQC